MPQPASSWPPPLVYTDPLSARVAYAALDLTPELLWPGLNYGIAERNNLTANDPPWLGGNYPLTVQTCYRD